MIKRISVLIIFWVLLVSIFSDVSYAGGGGGGGGKKCKPEPPKYYSFEDLRNGIRNESFCFQNNNKPANALASLPFYLDYSLCAANNAKIASLLKSGSGFTIDTSHTYSAWKDNVEISFDWNKYKSNGLRGDLIFTRGNGKGPDFVKMFSNWTHVAIVDDVQNKNVFESTIDYGVKVDYGPDTFKNITYYTCKKIETLPQNARSYLVDEAKRKYAKLPYFPQMPVTEALFRFLFVWSDKEDLSSMYCSKLVYQTYKNQINLDTARTSLPSSSTLVDRNKPAPGGYLFSWIGISPDNIYYLPTLGPDFCYSYNLLSLNQ